MTSKLLKHFQLIRQNNKTFQPLVHKLKIRTLPKSLAIHFKLNHFHLVKIWATKKRTNDGTIGQGNSKGRTAPTYRR
ncbi:MAG: hypothetical protein CM1200mP30_25690 [Pseudomonadota bacterium]|nr:MAG: hypothetical protein CM1200mP30_25690 [Pseudomonadota bacterium]